MRDATRRREVGDQHLAAPQRSVRPIAETVEGDAEHRLGAAVLHHARGDMSVVVLHGDGRQAELGGPLAGEVLGMHVVGDDLRRDAVEPRQMVDRLQERPIGGEVLEIADVMARHDPIVLGDADGALQFGADREDRAACAEGAASAAPARSRASVAAPAAAPRSRAPRSRRSGCGSAGRAAAARPPAGRGESLRRRRRGQSVRR